MDSLIGVLIISSLFVLFSTIIYFLIKKNIFGSEKKGSSYALNINRKENINKLEELKRENESLEKEIKFLEDKNKRLRVKIDQMRTVIKNLEEQKRQLEKSERRLENLRVQKDETLTMVAHDIKNPASTIKNFVELLESYDLSAQEQQDVFAGLVETSSRLLKLANEFTNVIAEEYTPFQLAKKKHNIKDAIDKIVKVNRVKAGEKNIELRLYQPEEELELEFDEEKIKEVVDNFVSNAIKFCPQNSKVDVITKFANNSICVEISDNGFGLTEAEISQVFEKGSKFSNKPTGKESSSGLGLWIAKKIIVEHEGKVWVKSKKGFGSTFAFTLPIK